MSENKKIKIFISYAHEDYHIISAFCQKSYDWARRNNVEFVYDEKFTRNGYDFVDEITREIDNSDGLILFVSTYSLKSKFIRNIEYPLILRREKHGGLRVFRFLVDKCHYYDYMISPTKKIDLYDHVSGALKPIKGWKPYNNVYIEIRKKLKEWLDTKPKHSSSSPSIPNISTKPPITSQNQSKGDPAGPLYVLLVCFMIWYFWYLPKPFLKIPESWIPPEPPRVELVLPVVTDDTPPTLAGFTQTVKGGFQLPKSPQIACGTLPNRAENRYQNLENLRSEIRKKYHSTRPLKRNGLAAAKFTTSTGDYWFVLDLDGNIQGEHFFSHDLKVFSVEIFDENRAGVWRYLEDGSWCRFGFLDKNGLFLKEKASNISP